MSRHEIWYPLDTWQVTQPFGANPDYYNKNYGTIAHNGIDALAYDGQIVRAPHDGIVTFAGEDGSGGLGIVIRTKDQREDINGDSYFWKAILWHLKPGTFKVTAGDDVKVGDIIAGADNTGKSTGTHLHTGCKAIQQGEADWQWDNVFSNNGYNGAVDPALYFNNHYAYEAQLWQKLIVILKQAVILLKNKLNAH